MSQCFWLTIFLVRLRHSDTEIRLLPVWVVLDLPGWLTWSRLLSFAAALTARLADGVPRASLKPGTALPTVGEEREWATDGATATEKVSKVV